MASVHSYGQTTASTSVVGIMVCDMVMVHLPRPKAMCITGCGNPICVMDKDVLCRPMAMSMKVHTSKANGTEKADILHTMALRMTVFLPKVCDMGMLPMSAEIDGETLPQSGELCLIVSNTASNETVAKRDFVADYFPKAEIGPYITKYVHTISTFELRRPPLAFGGTLVIEKMKH